MPRRTKEVKPSVIPWRFAAILAGSILALGAASAVVMVGMNRQSRTTYDDGIADPADFSREEEAVRLLVMKAHPRATDVKFGPNYRFTKYERTVKRLDPGYESRMRVLRRRATNPTDPPASAVRVVFLEPRPGRSPRVADMVYILDGNLETVLSNTNGHGDDWVAAVIPDWR